MNPKLKYSLLVFIFITKFSSRTIACLLICHLTHVYTYLFISISKLSVQLIVFEIFLCSFVHLNLYHNIDLLPVNGSTALCWTFAASSVSWSLTESVGLLARGSARHKAATYTWQPKHKINTHRHPCLQWDSSPTSQCSRGRRQFMP
jgi:hypothetical protein